jgi:hypothetical protein
VRRFTRKLGMTAGIARRPPDVAATGVFFNAVNYKL